MKMTWHYTILEEYLALGLRGFELTIYAIIASYSQGGQGCYFGGLPYLAKVAGCHPDTARKIVTKLCEAGLLHKEQIIRPNGKYLAISLPEERAKRPEGCGRNTRRGAGEIPASSEPSPYMINNESTIVDSTKEYKGEAPAPQHFVKPSVDEVAQYCRDRNNTVDAEAFVAFYESNGWKVGGRAPMRDWRAAVVTWEKRQHEQRKAQRRERKEESVFEHNMRVLDNLTGSNYHEQIYGQQADEY